MFRAKVLIQWAWPVRFRQSTPSSERQTFTVRSWKKVETSRHFVLFFHLSIYYCVTRLVTRMFWYTKLRNTSIQNLYEFIFYIRFSSINYRKSKNNDRRNIDFDKQKFANIWLKIKKKWKKVKPENQNRWVPLRPIGSRWHRPCGQSASEPPNRLRYPKCGYSHLCPRSPGICKFEFEDWVQWKKDQVILE